MLREAIAARARLPAEARRRVHLATLPMDDLEENAVIVNALQRHAFVVVQKSLAEGFGLTVAEAMWKGRPVVASKVGGIQDQIADGESGILLDDPHDLAGVRGGDHRPARRPRQARADRPSGARARARPLPQRAQPARLPRPDPAARPGLIRRFGGMTRTERRHQKRHPRDVSLATRRRALPQHSVGSTAAFEPSVGRASRHLLKPSALAKLATAQVASLQASAYSLQKTQDAHLQVFHGARRTRTADLLGAIQTNCHAENAPFAGLSERTPGVPQHLPQQSAPRLAKVRGRRPTGADEGAGAAGLQDRPHRRLRAGRARAARSGAGDLATRPALARRARTGALAAPTCPPQFEVEAAPACGSAHTRQALPVTDWFGARCRRLLTRLGLPEPWQGTIEASLRPRRPPGVSTKPADP